MFFSGSRDGENICMSLCKELAVLTRDSPRRSNGQKRKKLDPKSMIGSYKQHVKRETILSAPFPTRASSFSLHLLCLTWLFPAALFQYQWPWKSCKQRSLYQLPHCVSFMVRPPRVSFSRAIQNLCASGGRKGRIQPALEENWVYMWICKWRVSLLALVEGCTENEEPWELSQHMVWQVSVSREKLYLFALMDIFGLISCPEHQPLLLQAEEEIINPITS